MIVLRERWMEGRTTFARMVSDAIAASGDLQRDIASKLDIDAARLSRLANGNFKETPPPEELAAIERELGVSQLDLLQAIGYALGTEEPDIPFDDPRSRIAALIRRVRWDNEREYTIIRMLNGYIELDKKGE